ncbi:transporter substrate-binding domain-containing protein [Cohnella terricola]|uniref:Transporter substrate-binding domain-containing protein n=1 Tax=Cohnella terricola TaxID=1289167 RepID=A0A559JWS0_9BACL|nr:transporter substrate-binding domain-containing protein [Cohnella terricola]TVY04250.1 transporter substrate-binding domain-containing protein [Cohnella terricola]
MKNRMFVFIVLALVLVISGCGTKKNEGGVQKIIVGATNQFPQVSFLDKDGKLTGYDIELVREIDKRLPNYEFEFKILDALPSMLLSLDTNKIDMIAHEIAKNPERDEKYLFNKVPYAYWKNMITVAKDNNDPIETLDDVKGKKFLTHASSSAEQVLKNYNKDHDNAIELVYASGDVFDIAEQISTGRVYASLQSDFVLPVIDPQGKLKTVGKPLSQSEILFLFRKNDSEGQTLADAIDKVLQEMKEDGTLSALSKQWLGQDFTTAD